MTVRHASWMAVVVASACGAAAGCEDEPSPGASSSSTSAPSTTGGGGASGGAAAAGGGGSGGDVSATGGTSADPCGNLCDTFAELGGCGLYSCTTQCPAWIEHAGDCAPQMAAEIDCIADNTTQCGQDVCHPEYAALDACAGGVDCFGESCKGTSRGMTDTCECSTGCSTGALQVVCVTIGAEPTECECRKGGRMIGRCTQGFSYCDLSSGCCAQFF